MVKDCYFLSFRRNEKLVYLQVWQHHLSENFTHSVEAVMIGINSKVNAQFALVRTNVELERGRLFLTRLPVELPLLLTGSVRFLTRVH